VADNVFYVLLASSRLGYVACMVRSGLSWKMLNWREDLLPIMENLLKRWTENWCHL